MATNIADLAKEARGLDVGKKKIRASIFNNDIVPAFFAGVDEIASIGELLSSLVNTISTSNSAHNWLTQEFELKPSKLNRFAGNFKSWILPIGDTGYTYAFLGASTEPLKQPHVHTTMQRIFKHLIAIQRGHNRESCFFTHTDYRRYLKNVMKFEPR